MLATRGPLRAFPRLHRQAWKGLTSRAYSRQQTGYTSRYSLFFSNSVPKQIVLDQLSQHKGSISRTLPESVSPQTSPDATVILASRDLASWLEDEAVVSSLLDSVQSGPEQEISVLAAAVDGLCPSSPLSTTRSGLSVLHGAVDDILPGVWATDNATERETADVQPSVSVSLNPFLGDAGPLQVTFPLANTVFQTGRPYTLLASRYKKKAGGAYQAVSVAERQSQLIVPGCPSIHSYSNVSSLLLPISQPRKVVTGLGNIIRQVEIDGKPAPASKELEMVIPELFRARSMANNDYIPGPVGVWALIMPKEVAMAGIILDRAALASADDIDEHALASKVASHFSQLLKSGCHLHKILSGGGGWGLKQGLLSLDPQIKHSSDDDGVESFIKSFQGEPSADSIVTPGTFVQFFVEPLIPAETTICPSADEPSELPPLVFGTRAEILEDSSSQNPYEPVTFENGHFGAISSSGIFLFSEAGSMPGSSSNGIRTKLDVPFSYIWEGSRRWLP